MHSTQKERGSIPNALSVPVGFPRLNPFNKPQFGLKSSLNVCITVSVIIIKSLQEFAGLF